jgi:signal transduction histidine kinase
MWFTGAIFGLFCLTAAALATGIREVRRRRRAEQAARASLDQYESVVRLARLAAADQRNVALALQGHAQVSEPADAALTGLARRLIDLSENLAEQIERPDAPRYLLEEEVPLVQVIEFAMAQVAAHLGPGRRSWRLAPELRDARLLADRRAMNQVLVNVLSGAASTTRNGDLIELTAEAGRDEWALVVQDEGVGLPVGSNEAGRTEGRGIGLRLTLARSLMQAHDGALTVESAERVGTRVRLSFPMRRVLA